MLEVERCKLVDKLLFFFGLSVMCVCRHSIVCRTVSLKISFLHPRSSAMEIFRFFEIFKFSFFSPTVFFFFFWFWCVCVCVCVCGCSKLNSRNIRPPPTHIYVHVHVNMHKSTGHCKKK